jgi:hypothetical protein
MLFMAVVKKKTKRTHAKNARRLKRANYRMAYRTKRGRMLVGKIECEQAWNKDPVFGVIGIQSGPRG